MGSANKGSEKIDLTKSRRVMSFETRRCNIKKNRKDLGLSGSFLYSLRVFNVCGIIILLKYLLY